MKKIFLLFSVFAFAFTWVSAQVDEKTAAEEALKTKVKAAEIDSAKHWKCTGIVGLNAAQTGLFNWAAGGNNNVTGFVYANVTLSYKKNKWTWDSNLDTELGLMYSADYVRYPWRKANDKLNFTTKVGYQMHPQWYLTLLGSFRSQYAPGMDYKKVDAGEELEPTLISKWLSPSYTDLALGIEYRPNDIFTIGVYPVAGRMTTCTYEPLRPSYGLPMRDDSTFKPVALNMGLRINGGINYTLVKNLKIISTITLFTPYTARIHDEEHGQKFGNFDVDWDVAIAYSFLKVFSVSVMTSLKYYEKVMIDGPAWGKYHEGPRARVQFKEVIGVGIGYSF
ncbi:MAG: DUF3078 domain-containing protein [Bacteroidales bacterium]|jgi:hypothetical protein|nr:DUF3078 domain-containing protein [Bacteroidales bacterium]